MKVNVLIVLTLIVGQGKHKEGGNESHENRDFDCAPWID